MRELRALDLSFHAAPDKICSGDHVALDWNASKTETISATPQQPTPGEVPAKRTASVAPTSSARFHLEVSNLWGAAGRDDDVELLAGHALEKYPEIAHWLSP